MKWILVLLSVTGCEDEDPCRDYDPPELPAEVACEAADLEDPLQLSACTEGGGSVGRWTTDAHGLPAFDLMVDHRCDEAFEVTLASETVANIDPLHLISNGRGVVAQAHASGAVEFLSAKRGSQWLNHVDEWRDKNNKAFPRQIGGGFNYLVVDGEVKSTRFDDLSPAVAIERQQRRFGVGYVETVTTHGDIVVTRRVFAPDNDSQVLVAEVTLENRGESYVSVGLVEFWDVNLHQLTPRPPEDFASSETFDEVRRERRALSGDAIQIAAYDKETRIANIESTSEGAASSERVFLAPIDEGPAPVSVWLSDDELWAAGSSKRPPPARAGKAGTNESRTLDLTASEQSGVLALRVNVSVPTQNPVVRRFAFGREAFGSTSEMVVNELRRRHGELRDEAQTRWKEHLAWVAVDGEKGAALQRELAWSSYYVQGSVIFDGLRGGLSLMAGGEQRFLYGLSAATSDAASTTTSLNFLRPDLSRRLLLSSLASQMGPGADTPGKYLAGVGGTDSDPYEGQDLRTDAYGLMPLAIAKYVATTRDVEFLRSKAPYFPAASEEVGTVPDHLSLGLDYMQSYLGDGAHGLVGTGTSDSAEPLVFEAGASSPYGAAITTLGFPLLAKQLAESEPELASAFSSVANDQRVALETAAWNGEYFERAFDASGGVIDEGRLYLAPQVVALAAGLVSEPSELQARIAALVSDYGVQAHSVSEAAPQIVPDLNAWYIQSIASSDANAAWEALVRSSLFADARRNALSWSAPSYTSVLDPYDAYSAVDDARGYVANALQRHAGSLHGALAILGVSGTAAGLEIDPHFPSENFHVQLPRIALQGTPESLVGRVAFSADTDVELRVRVPSGLRQGDLSVDARGEPVDYEREGDFVIFTVRVRANEALEFSLRADAL